MDLGLAYFEFAFQEPELYILLFSCFHSRKISLEHLKREGSPITHLFSAIEKGVESGEFELAENHMVEPVTFAFWAFVHGIVMLEQTHLKSFDADFQSLRPASLSTFFNGFIK